MNINIRRATTVLVGTALTVAGLTIAASVAEAHTPSGGADCTKGVWVTATSYEAGDTNTMEVKLDGKETIKTFATSGSLSVPIPADGQQHSWSAYVHTTNHNPAYSQNYGPGTVTCTAPVQHVTVVAPSFSNQLCTADHTYVEGTVTAPDTVGTTHVITGTPSPGATVEVKYTAQSGYVIDGQSDFFYTYPSSPVPSDCQPTTPPPGPPTTPPTPPTPPCTACTMPYKDTTAPASTDCRGVISDRVLQDVNVRPGFSCTLVNVWVNGSVTTHGARALTLAGADVRGNVIARGVTGDVTFGATNSSCAADPMVGGSVFVQGSHNVTLCELTVCHKIVVRHNDGRIGIRATTANTLRLSHNRRFVSDGDAHHAHVDWIRLLQDTFRHTWIHHNAPRKVLVRG